MNKNLEILEEKMMNKRKYYYCKCKLCGNEKWIRRDGYKKALSCGCLSKQSYFKSQNLLGKKFGKLLVIEETKDRCVHSGSVMWKCQCDCGNIAICSSHNLKRGGTISCGCYRKITSTENLQIGIKKHLQENIIEHTNIPAISRTTVQSNNTSGYTGVKWDKNRQKWAAEIKFKNKWYYLGRYENKEDAIKAREEAKEKLHNKFLRELEQKNNI